jgi:hypothetical protein
MDGLTTTRGACRAKGGGAAWVLYLFPTRPIGVRPENRANARRFLLRLSAAPTSGLGSSSHNRDRPRTSPGLDIRASCLWVSQGQWSDHPSSSIFENPRVARLRGCRLGNTCRQFDQRCLRTGQISEDLTARNHSARDLDPLRPNGRLAAACCTPRTRPHREPLSAGPSDPAPELGASRRCIGPRARPAGRTVSPKLGQARVESSRSP